MTIIGILGIAQTLIILTAGIDLSVGIVMVLASIVMGRLSVVLGFPVEVGFVAGLLVGALCGCLNGLLVTRLRMPPFIVTLGTLSIFTALNTWYSRSESIRNGDLHDKAPFLLAMGQPIQFGSARIIYGSVLMLLLAAFVLVPAQQDRARAAHLRGGRRSGSGPPRGHRRRARAAERFMSLASLISAIAGWVLIGTRRRHQPDERAGCQPRQHHGRGDRRHEPLGGRGSIVGTLVGALIVGVFRSSVSLAGLDVLWQQFAVGVLIIVAVALDQWIRKVSA